MNFTILVGTINTQWTGTRKTYTNKTLTKVIQHKNPPSGLPPKPIVHQKLKKSWSTTLPLLSQKMYIGKYLL